MNNTVIISLGTNLWDRKSNLNKAINEIKQIASVEKVSSYIETKFWVPEGHDNEIQPNYLNAICKITTDKTPTKLLEQLQNIEDKMGRVPGRKWGPRIIDLDIITYNKEKINLPNLKIPHPYSKDRDFVMKPLGEVDNEIRSWLAKQTL